MSELHPIEAAWRRFRASAGGSLLNRCLTMRQSYLDSVGLKCCPAEVVLPGAVPWNLLALDEARVRGEEIGRWLSDEASYAAHAVHVWAAYRKSKSIYQVEPALAECLDRSEWPEGTPTAALRLPSHCPVFAVPLSGATWGIAEADLSHNEPLTRGVDGDTAYLAATYDLVTGAEETGALELRLSLYVEQTWCPVSTLHLTRGTLRECINAAAAEARSHGAPEQSADAWRNEMGGLALTFLLYLGGDPDVVRIVHPGERSAVKPKLARRDPERYADLREPTSYAVGKTFAQAIERWEIEHAGETGDPTGRSVRPHMRRAHSHLYWTGRGRENPRVRFLLPISVRGGRLIEEPAHPTATTVR